MNEQQKRRTIVCIEDEAGTIELVKVILQGLDYEVIGALGGKVGMEVIREVRPDLILLDIMMPEISGWEVYKRLQEDEELAEIPVLVVTAKSPAIDFATDEAKYKNVPYIYKPFTPSRLITNVKKLLGEDDG